MNGSCQAKRLIAVSNGKLLRNRQKQAVAAVGLTEIDTHNSLLISGFSSHSFMPMC